MISGPFTNWNPMKMMKIEDFCMLIDQKFPNLIDQMRAAGQCRPECSVLEDLNTFEKIEFDLLMKTTKLLYKNNWQPIIDKNKRFANTN